MAGHSDIFGGSISTLALLQNLEAWGCAFLAKSETTMEGYNVSVFLLWYKYDKSNVPKTLIWGKFFYMETTAQEQ